MWNIIADTEGNEAVQPIEDVIPEGWIVEAVTCNPNALVPVEPEVVVVSPRQFRMVLTRAGIRSEVETFVASASQDIKDWWEYSIEIRSDNENLIEAATQLGYGNQLDALFELAATL